MQSSKQQLICEYIPSTQQPDVGASDTCTRNLPAASQLHTALWGAGSSFDAGAINPKATVQWAVIWALIPLTDSVSTVFQGCDVQGLLFESVPGCFVGAIYKRLHPKPATAFKTTLSSSSISILSVAIDTLEAFSVGSIEPVSTTRTTIVLSTTPMVGFAITTFIRLSTVVTAGI